MRYRITKNEKTLAWLILIILSLIWGSSFILIKKGLAGLSPLQVGTLRISFAFLFTFPFAIKYLGKIPYGKWKFLFFTGLFSNFLPAVLFALAQTKLESSLTGILNALSPLFTLLIAVLVFNLRFSIAQVSGLITGFIGIIGLSFVNSDGGLGNFNAYVWLIVLATLCYAVSLNFIKIYLSGLNSVMITSLALLTAGPPALAILFLTDFPAKLAGAPEVYESIGYVAILGILGTAVALLLYTKLIHMTNAIFASSVTYLVPVVAILWGVIDNEKLYPLHFAGLALILTGIYFSNKTGKSVKGNNVSKK